MSLAEHNLLALDYKKIKKVAGWRGGYKNATQKAQHLYIWYR